MNRYPVLLLTRVSFLTKVLSLSLLLSACLVLKQPQGFHSAFIHPSLNLSCQESEKRTFKFASVMISTLKWTSVDCSSYVHTCLHSFNRHVCDVRNGLWQVSSQRKMLSAYFVWESDSFPFSSLCPLSGNAYHANTSRIKLSISF